MWNSSARRHLQSAATRHGRSFWTSSTSGKHHIKGSIGQFLLDTFALWHQKIEPPRGFEDFGPPSTNKAPPTSSKQTSSFRSSDDNKKQQQQNNKKQPPPPDDSANLPGLLALLVLVMAIRQFLDETNEHEGQEISFVEFRDKLLSQTEKLVVVNQNLVKVILKKDYQKNNASSDFEHDNPGNPFGGGAEPTESIQFESSSSVNNSTSSSTGRNPNGSSAYYFYIANVESFEERMTKAQEHLSPEEWTEIQYVNVTNWGIELLKFAPAAAFVAAVYFGTKGMMGRGRGSAGGIFSIGKSNAKQIKPQDVNVKFKDVAGCEEAKREIMEFVDFLKDSDRFTKLGAKIPKGALLCGPPGTGKTLLAKATAGEAGVPFFSISGSDFIEMFVGVGPSRVRDLFKEARSKAPCIVFIDEIDAVGRQRGRGGFSGGNDERENTLNQLLVEMDGFSPTTGIVVLAGTNRVDILDEALTRPGRFDRQVQVDKPDLKGRKEIFKVHLKGIKLEGDVDDYASRLAGLTPGFAGADIANICNEAAIVAARRKATSVTSVDFEKATDRIIGGLESHKIMSEEEKAVVAYHEAGHAVAGWFLEHSDPLLKVTIIPRSSGALGFAQYLPKEVFLRSQEQIMDIVCMALAGRASEEVFFGRVTTGAADDLRRVTQIVYSTIKDFGMNDKVGQLSFPKDEQQMGDKPYSDSTAEAMDDEARAIVDAAYQRTVDLIREHKEDTEKVAKLLLEKETITHDDIYDLVGPRPFVQDKAYSEYVSNRKREILKPKEKVEDEVVDPGLTPGLA